MCGKQKDSCVIQGCFNVHMAFGKKTGKEAHRGSLLCGPSRDGDAVLVEAVFSMCSNKKSTEVTF